jgi:hypothetical protein
VLKSALILMHHPFHFLNSKIHYPAFEANQSHQFKESSMNNRYLKQLILTAILMAPLSWATNIDDKMAKLTLMEERILSKYYPNYNKTHECYVAVDDEGATYCLKRDKRRVIETAQGLMMYLLVTGDVFDFKEGEANAGRQINGYVSMFVAKISTDVPEVVAYLLNTRAGQYGQAPQDWTFDQFGPESYGFINTPYYSVMGGYNWRSYMILTHQGDTTIQEHSIPAAETEPAVYDENEVYDENSKLIEQIELSSDFEIDRSLAISTGLYPLIITVNGYIDKGKTKFKNKVYAIPYDANKKTYIAPKDYPFKWDD